MLYSYNKKSIKEKSKVVLAGFMALLSLGTSASLLSGAHAKEITSGGATGGTVTATCNPVKSLTYQGDARVGELGFAQISVKYSVSPCDKNVPVRVGFQLIENAPNTVFYDYQDAPLSAALDINGVKVNTSYKAVVTVYDANTGAVIGGQTIFAAARTKGV